MTTEAAARPNPRRRVAVIAVHGVGSPPPGQTARNVTELLMQQVGDRGGRYDGFEERNLYVPTAPLDRTAPAGPPAASPGDEQAPATTRKLRKRAKGRTTLGLSHVESGWEATH